MKFSSSMPDIIPIDFANQVFETVDNGSCEASCNCAVLRRVRINEAFAAKGLPGKLVVAELLFLSQETEISEGKS